MALEMPDMTLKILPLAERRVEENIPLFSATARLVLVGGCHGTHGTPEMPPRKWPHPSTKRKNRAVAES
jgi:hypothetical protein